MSPTLQNKIEEAKKRFEEKMSWLARYYRPIQINEDYSRRDETADIREMLEEKQVFEVANAFLEQELSSIATLAQKETERKVLEDILKLLDARTQDNVFIPEGKFRNDIENYAKSKGITLSNNTQV